MLSSLAASFAVVPNDCRGAALAADDVRGPEESMYSLKFVQTYDDFATTPEGWLYKDVKVGNRGDPGTLEDGNQVVFDWSSYTIGYFGRPFEAKG